LLEENRQRFMGTVGVPERYALPRDGQIVEIRYLYCHPGADGKLIQAKYFGKIRNDVALGDCSVNQLKLKADESDPTES
jgi:bifunctional non-homologous end joining protein LigD